MQESGVMSEAVQAIFALKTEYSTPYGALLREDVVMGVSRYFLERWVPVLGTGPATVVNTLRQLDYRCHDDVITISGEALAREAAMSRRYLYTCLDTPWMSAFIRQESGQHKRDAAGKIIQQANRYVVRMDDPLNPADADHLLAVLNLLADTPLEAARRALTIEPRELWAPVPTQSPERFTEPRALTTRDVLMRAFPTWKPADDTQKQELSQAAEALQRHVTLTRDDGRTSKIIVPQYFRNRWWKRLGHDLAWAYLWLRGCVYDNPGEGIRRETCWIPSLNTLLAIIGRPREWWRRNVENAKPQPDNWQVTDFFEQINAQKGRDLAHPQWVARQFAVALTIPVAPEDRVRYETLLHAWAESAPILAERGETSASLPSDIPQKAGSATLRHTGESVVRHTETHRSKEGSPQMDTPVKAGSATNGHTGNGGVCHTETQASATSTHRNPESTIQALLKDPKHITTSKHPLPKNQATSETHALGAAAAKKTSLIDQIGDQFDQDPAMSLYRCADPQSWLQETWPEPVRPHTPAWVLVTGGQVTPRDLVALILAIWADSSIKHPPRYLSWIIQRWQTQPDAPPVDHWEEWCALADLPIGEWLDKGRAMWIERAARDNRALPFGLDTLAAEGDTSKEFFPPVFAAEPAVLPPIESTPAETVANGLDERPGAGKLTIREIWLATLGQLRLQLNRSTYVNWVEGAKAVSYADGVLTVRARHIMARDWLAERLNYSIEETASALAHYPITIRYVVDPPLRVTPELSALES
jgi:hypothetical protein